jgi:hypothetical protein
MTARVSLTTRPEAGSARPPAVNRLLIVSYMSNVPYSPRGIRTRALAEALGREWNVELVGGPNEGGSRSISATEIFRPLRRVIRFAYSSTLLDKFEPWSWRRFRSWEPAAEGALLIGFPFSPVVYAARRLQQSGIPYIVDAGDPWVLTGKHPELRGVGRLRALAAERRLWSGAAGAILTTHAQASALQTLFPALRLLVRPNGFFPADDLARVQIPPQAVRPGSRLRLAHYGDISSDRVPIDAFLKTLARSGHWREVEFHQFGQDWTGKLQSLRDLRVVFHDPRPWSEVVAAAHRYDLAVVIGNRDPMLLPSKAVAYLQLPIPRLAVVADANNAVTDYVRGKPGWLVLGAGDSTAAAQTYLHVSRSWTANQLAAPLSESWDQVCSDVRGFIKARVDRRLARNLATTE